MVDLPGRKRILLHLSDRKDSKKKKAYSFSYCQEGIAEAVGLSQNRVSKLLEEMKDKGIIGEDVGDVKGSPQRRKVYHLTEKGVDEADDLKETIGEKHVRIKTKRGVSRIKLKDIDKYVNGSKLFLFAVNHLDSNSLLDLTDIGGKKSDDDISSQPIEDLFRSKNSTIVNVDSFGWKETRRLIMKRTGRVEIPDYFIDMILDITEGTSLFINALLDDMVEKGILEPLKLRFPESIEELPLPEKIKSIYEPKYGKLNDRAKKILEFCSCIRKDIPYDFIKNTLHLEKEDIDEIIETGLLTKNNEGYLSFTYNMIWFTIYKMLSPNKKKDLHMKIAEELESIENKKNYCIVAEHYEKAGDLEKACQHYLKAAEKAEERYDNDEAMNTFKRVLELDDEDDIKDVDRNHIIENISDLQRREKYFEKALDRLNTVKGRCEKFEEITRIDRKRTTCLRKMRDYDEAIDLVEKRLDDLSQKDDLSFDLKEEKCKLLKEKGMIHLRKNDYDESKRTFFELKRLSQEIDSKKDEATAVHYLGSLAYFRSDFKEAKEKLHKAIEMRKNINDLEGLSSSYTNIGVVYRSIQEHRRAIKYYKKANDIEKKIGSENGDPAALTNIGNVYGDLGELDKAIEYHEICIEIEKEKGDTHGIASSLDNIGVIYSKKGQFDKAIEYNKKSLEKKKEIENRLGMSYSYYNLGGAYREKSEFDKAVDYLEKSLEIRRELDNRLNIGYSYLDLGITYLQMIKLDKARSHLEKALDVFKETQTDHGMGIALSYLGKLNTMKGSMEEAKKDLNYSESIKSNMDEFRLSLIVERHLAEYYLKKNRVEKALSYCKKSILKAKESGMMNDLGKSKKILGKIYHQKSLDWKAVDEFDEAIEIFNRIGAKKNKAESLFYLGKLLEERKDEDGSKKIEKALEILKDCGIDPQDFQQIS